MPKLYEYFGLVVFFYAGEHEPIHVHGRYQEHESKAELIVRNGKVVEIRIVSVQGRKPLQHARRSDFKKLVELYADEIVDQWVNYFVMHKKLKTKKLHKKLQ